MTRKLYVFSLLVTKLTWSAFAATSALARTSGVLRDVGCSWTRRGRAGFGGNPAFRSYGADTTCSSGSGVARSRTA